jgi:hypothetical protein
MRHTFEIDEIFVNPKLPEDFDITPHDERDDDMNWWWDKPYIEIEELSEETWIEHYHRLKDDFTPEQLGTEQEYIKRIEESRISWFKTWYTGFRYEVRCLDGAAWDRSTNYGMYATFEEALSVAKNLI